MAKINITNDAAGNIDTPSSGQTSLYVDSTTKKLVSKDDTGTTVSYDAPLVEGNIDHDALTNFVANEHVDHSSVDITTGATSGLSGGGDLTSTRTLLVDPNRATSGTVASGDEVLIADVDDSNNLKKVTAQSIADLGGGGGGMLTPESFSSAGWKNIGYTHFFKAVNANNKLGDIWIVGTSAASALYDSTLNEATAPGVFMVGNATSGGAWARIFNGQNNGIVVGAIPYVQTSRIKLSAVPDATNDFEFVVGFADNIIASATDKCWMGADISVNATNFSITCGNGTDSTVDTGIAMDTSWHIFQVYMTSTEAKFYIDGSLVHTETTNLPTGSLDSYPANYRFVAGDARYGAIDLASLDYKPTTLEGWFDITTL